MSIFLFNLSIAVVALELHKMMTWNALSVGKNICVGCIDPLSGYSDKPSQTDPIGIL